MSRAIKKRCTICGKPFQIYLSKKDCRASMSPKIKKSPDAPNGTPGDLPIQVFYQYLSAGSLSPSGCNVSVLQCPAAGAAQRTAVRLSYGLPSQAAAVICCRSSPCSAAGSTTRAAATGSTEPKRLRQLSGVAHHSAKRGKPVTKCHQFVDVTKMVMSLTFEAGKVELIRKNGLF